MKTLYVKVGELSQYLRYNKLTVQASTGPNANITGMRKQYWGKDAHIIKSGQYLYKVHKIKSDY